MGTRLEDICPSVNMIVSFQMSSMEWICHDMSIRVEGFCWTNRNLKGSIAGYREILADQVHRMRQILFPAGNSIFQDDNAPIHAVDFAQSWFDEYEDKVQNLP
ncbi:DDE_3 domain-containing protein [Trichonephila clavipes]|nr:DDE_3 domain-containing protein [Trichonephila clavipes]